MDPKLEFDALGGTITLMDCCCCNAGLKNSSPYVCHLSTPAWCGWLWYLVSWWLLFWFMVIKCFCFSIGSWVHTEDQKLSCRSSRSHLCFISRGLRNFVLFRFCLFFWTEQKQNGWLESEYQNSGIGVVRHEKRFWYSKFLLCLLNSFQLCLITIMCLIVMRWWTTGSQHTFYCIDMDFRLGNIG